MHRFRSAFSRSAISTYAIAWLCGISTMWLDPRPGVASIDAPLPETPHEISPYFLDSGEQSNVSDEPAAIFAEIIEFSGSDWLRLYFDSVVLEAGGYLRVTSLFDQEVQELEVEGLSLWQNSTAYFNGDAVLLELVAAPNTSTNRVVLSSVGFESSSGAPRGGTSPNGICGPDNRLPSSELWIGRLMPDRCTASVFAANSCLVSAGHCHDANMVVQFNVPATNPDCTINHPPVSDQFPIVNSAFIFDPEVLWDDWAVLVPGTNDVGQKPYDRYGELRVIASSTATVGQSINLAGYGVDATCTRNRAQQNASGPIAQVAAEYYFFSVDLQVGNSGSALLRNNQIVGIATRAGVPCPNFAVRVDRPGFAAARASLCSETSGACCLQNDTCTVLTATACVTANGEFLGPSAPCDACLQCALAGDLNEDGFIRGDDLPGYVRAKLGQPAQGGENPACADFETGTLEGDNAAFVAALIE